MAARRRLEPHVDSPFSVVRVDAHELLATFHLFFVEHEKLEHHGRAVFDANDGYFAARPQVLPAALLYVFGLRRGGKVRESYELTRGLMDRIDDVDAPALVFAAAHAHVLASRYLDITEAIDAAQLALSHREAASPTAVNHLETLYSGALMLAGRTAEARVMLDDTIAAGAEIPTVAMYRDLTEFDSAQIDAQMQDPEELAPKIVARAAELRESGDREIEFMMLGLRSRMAVPDEDTVDRLEEIAGDSTSGLMRLDARFAAARHRADREALAAVADDYETEGYLIYGAEAIARALELAQEQGASSFELKSLSRRHDEYLASCPGLRHSRVMVAVDDVALTDREREVAELGGRGWSNKEIADHLSISVRTVENNLQRAYAKLGINRRTQLADALGIQAA